IRFDGKSSDALCNRGLSHFAKKSHEQASRDIKEGLQLDPKAVWANACMAWFLATCPEAKFRDGKKALEFAKKSIESDRLKYDILYEKLAAAHAELGNFDEAIRAQERALRDPLLKDDAEARQRLELYRKKMPYRAE